MPNEFSNTSFEVHQVNHPARVEVGQSATNVLSKPSSFMGGFDLSVQLQVGCPGGYLFRYVRAKRTDRAWHLHKLRHRQLLGDESGNFIEFDFIVLEYRDGFPFLASFEHEQSRQLGSGGIDPVDDGLMVGRQVASDESKIYAFHSHLQSSAVPSRIVAL